MAKTESRSSSSFLVQGSILAVASILTRIIGILYRVPMTNILGDAGMGVYSSAYSIYSIILLASSFGIPTALSRMVAARAGLKQYRNMYHMFRVAVLVGAIIGVIAGAVTFFGAPFFANTVLNNPSTVYGIRMLAPTVMISCFLGVFRGYYQGMGSMIPTAVSQIFEQIVNAVFSVLGAWWLFNQGTILDAELGLTSTNSAAFGAAGGTIGTGAGALTALFVCVFIYMMYYKTQRRRVKRDKTTEVLSGKVIAKTLILTMLPIVFNSAIYNISSVIDNSLFGHYTTFAGIHDQLNTLWGAYESKYHLLTHVPLAFATALSASTVPAISRALGAGDEEQASQNINSAIRLTMIIAIPSFLGLTVLALPVLNLLFKTDNTLASRLLILGSTTVVFYSQTTITSGILQGLNHINVPVRNAAIALVLHVVLMVALLWGFNAGIYGVVAADILFGITMNILNIHSIKKFVDYKQDIVKIYLLPLVSAGIMAVITRLAYDGLYKVVRSNTISVLVAIVIAVLVYAVLLMLTGCIREAEVRRFPKGATIVKIAKKLHLLR